MAQDQWVFLLATGSCSSCAACAVEVVHRVPGKVEVDDVVDRLSHVQAPAHCCGLLACPCTSFLTMTCCIAVYINELLMQGIRMPVRRCSSVKTDMQPACW